MRRTLRGAIAVLPGPLFVSAARVIGSRIVAVPPVVVLEGRFVRLEPLTEGHAEALACAAAEDRSTYRYTKVPNGADETIAYIAGALRDRDESVALPFATVAPVDGRVIGSTRFLDLQYWDAPVPSVAEIGGTWLTASAQRTPVNTEAKVLMLTHAFETWEVHRVSLKTDARNARSRTAIERLGARFDGVLRAHAPAADGGVRDSAFYSILDAEWPGVKRRLVDRLERG
jgi:RimJ/RimL family protein N-acetyltransferase